MNVEKKKIQRRKIKRVIIILLCAFLIGFPVFTYFRINTEARLALREAKNVNLAFQMLDIEYYAEGKTIFDSSSSNGLVDGAQDRINQILEHECDISIFSYSKKLRKVTGFTYATGNYRVIYRYDDNKGDTWNVDYFINVFNYDGE